MEIKLQIHKKVYCIYVSKIESHRKECIRGTPNDLTITKIKLCVSNISMRTTLYVSRCPELRQVHRPKYVCFNNNTLYMYDIILCRQFL